MQVIDKIVYSDELPDGLLMGLENGIIIAGTKKEDTKALRSSKGMGRCKK